MRMSARSMFCVYSCILMMRGHLAVDEITVGPLVGQFQRFVPTLLNFRASIVLWLVTVTGCAWAGGLFERLV